MLDPGRLYVRRRGQGGRETPKRWALQGTFRALRPAAHPSTPGGEARSGAWGEAHGSKRAASFFPSRRGNCPRPPRETAPFQVRSGWAEGGVPRGQVQEESWEGRDGERRCRDALKTHPRECERRGGEGAASFLVGPGCFCYYSRRPPKAVCFHWSPTTFRPRRAATPVPKVSLAPTRGTWLPWTAQPGPGAPAHPGIAGCAGEGGVAGISR